MSVDKVVLCFSCFGVDHWSFGKRVHICYCNEFSFAESSRKPNILSDSNAVSDESFSIFC